MMPVMQGTDASGRRRGAVQRAVLGVIALLAACAAALVPAMAAGQVPGGSTAKTTQAEGDVRSPQEFLLAIEKFARIQTFASTGDIERYLHIAFKVSLVKQVNIEAKVPAKGVSTTFAASNDSHEFAIGEPGPSFQQFVSENSDPSRSTLWTRFNPANLCIRVADLKKYLPAIEQGVSVPEPESGRVRDRYLYVDGINRISFLYANVEANECAGAIEHRQFIYGNNSMRPRHSGSSGEDIE